ncbi:hypothetical protein HRG_010167 [Hirsutella rhossiliensis]|uniref:Uncharacterized protein n=1 Tax=Hirsutella rhossiliensis TaxID=111463 RepID=A0A9P8MNP8_9HYPO|nr:uncharacterized protein HRG_10167 [Hirsutella rhossiliensis]KAH0958480.1 hypothetical protein HRG_10167 [Hirsutella rhossiliensis]
MVRIAAVTLAFAAIAFAATINTQGAFGADIHLARRQNTTADGAPEIGGPGKIPQMIEAFERKIEDSPDKEIKKMYDDINNEIKSIVGDTDGTTGPKKNNINDNAPNKANLSGAEKASIPDESSEEQPKTSGV